MQRVQALRVEKDALLALRAQSGHTLHRNDPAQANKLFVQDAQVSQVSGNIRALEDGLDLGENAQPRLPRCQSRRCTLGVQPVDRQKRRRSAQRSRNPTSIGLIGPEQRQLDAPPKLARDTNGISIPSDGNRAPRVPSQHLAHQEAIECRATAGYKAITSGGRASGRVGTRIHPCHDNQSRLPCHNALDKRSQLWQGVKELQPRHRRWALALHHTSLS
jgi:hypothetical protein